MSTTTAEPTVDATNLVDEAQRAAEHAESASLARIRPEQQRFDENQRAILRQLGIEDATDGDLDLFFHYCRSTGLDPFRRQIYMIGRNTKVTEWVDGPGGRRKVERYVTKYTIQIGVDGYRQIVREISQARDENVQLKGPWFTGASDFHITDDGEVVQHWRKVWPGPQPPHAARFVVVRNGEEFEGIAHFAEYVQTGYGDEPNSMWRKMSRNQIAKCAETLAYRRAFPDRMSGLIIEDAAQPTVIDGETGEVISGGQPTPRQRSPRVTEDEIFAEEVPIPEPAEQAQPAESNIGGEISTPNVASESPAGDVAGDQGNGAPDDPEPSPAEQPEPHQVEEPAKRAPAKKAAAKRSTAPAADPERAKSTMRKALEKRHFTLIRDAGLEAAKDRLARLAVYRTILDRNDIESADDLDDVELTKISDQLYRWQTDGTLTEEIAAIIADAAADPTNEGTE